MATWAVVPVKHFKVGKSRLATVLSDRARAGLSVRLLKRTMGLLARSAVIHHTLVISCDDSALQLAREQGAPDKVERWTEALEHIRKQQTTASQPAEVANESAKTD